MNIYKIKPLFGQEVELKSQSPLFNLDEFLTNYNRLKNQGVMSIDRRRIFSMWRNYIHSNGFLGELEGLYRKYKVMNWRPFYQVIEFEDGSFSGFVHYKLLEGYAFQHQFDSRIEIELKVSLDKEGKQWKPTMFTEAEPVVGNIKEEVLNLLPFKNQDEKIVWFNRAITIALDYMEWVSVPCNPYSEEEEKELVKYIRKINKLVKDKEIVDFNGLKEYLKRVWVERRVPKIFR